MSSKIDIFIATHNPSTEEQLQMHNNYSSLNYFYIKYDEYKKLGKSKEKTEYRILYWEEYMKLLECKRYEEKSSLLLSLRQQKEQIKKISHELVTNPLKKAKYEKEYDKINELYQNEYIRLVKNDKFKKVRFAI